MLLLILFIGILLVILNVKAISKEKKDFNSVFKDKFDSMDDFSVEIGKLRNEFGETIYELQQEIVNLKKELKNYKSQNDKVVTSDIFEEDIELDEVFNNDKTKEITSDQVYNEIKINNKVTTNNTYNRKKSNYNVKKKSSVKYEEIDKLLREGFSVDEISEKLNMGKGEVLLIIELYLK